MPDKRCIVTATDLSQWAGYAETKGAEITKHLNNAEMLLVTVHEQSKLDFYTQLLGNRANTQRHLMLETQNKLDEKAKALAEKEGITVTPLIRTGKVPDEINALLTEKKASLLVLGAHGQGYHFMPIIGNIPAKVIQGSPCPVLIIRKEEVRPYKKVLIPIDFSEVSVNQVVQSLPFLPEDAEIILMSVCETPAASRIRYANISVEILENYRKTIEEEALEKINELIEAFDSPPNMHPHVEMGIPHQAILNYIKTNDIDLLVVGKHPRNRLEEYLICSTLLYAINEVVCDVMIMTPAPLTDQS